MHDTIIIGAGAAGLYAGLSLDRHLKKLILEKTAKPGMKVLMSGGERANVSNADIDPERDYFTQNKKFLLSLFARYSTWDTLSFFAENEIEIIEEDRSRLILKSGDSRELLDCLLKNCRKNGATLQVHEDVKSIKKLKSGSFEIQTAARKSYQAKTVVLASGGKSFPQIGSTGEAYNIVAALGLELVTPYRTLCGLATKTDLSEISGVSTELELVLRDRTNPKLVVYREFGPLLFTHFGVSGPIVHNCSNALGEYLNRIVKTPSEAAFESYVLEHMYLELTFSPSASPKRVVKFFDLSDENFKRYIPLQNWRSWREAKATGGGVSTANLDSHCQVKTVPGLYCIGEAVDVTGKTGGFNLQWAWTSAHAAAESINKYFAKNTK